MFDVLQSPLLEEYNVFIGSRYTTNLQVLLIGSLS